MSTKGKPLLFITGFLGAGKTTLLRELILELKARNVRTDVILNDFANAEIDAATLDSAVASVAPIAASCACCDSLGELVALCRAAANGDGDLLLIELNGTADPLALLESFTLLQEKLPFFPRLQVGVVDARHWSRRGDLSPLERRQVETAGFWIPTHTDQVDGNRLREIERSVALLAPFSSVTTARQLSDTLSGELVAANTSPRPHWPEPPTPGAAEGPSIGRRSLVDDEVHALSHRFTGCQFRLLSRVERDDLERLMRSLPDWVFRAKALVELNGHPDERWLFERSGKDPLPPPIRVSELKRVSCSLVCIGPRLDTSRLRKMVYDILYAGSSV